MHQFLLNRKTLYGSIVLLSAILIALGIRKILFVSARAASVEGPTGAAVSLSTSNNKTFFGTAEDVILQVSITNPNDHSIKILKWLTPLDGVKEPLFTVLRDGTPVAYLGPIYKRTAPTEQDYLTLAAGESLTSEVNLSALYDFSISGNYEISYEVASIQLYMEVDNERPKLTEMNRLTSVAIKLFIEGRSALKP